MERSAGVSVESLGDPIAYGRTAEIYAWKDGFVLKLFHNWRSLADVEHETQLARVVHETGLPVPAVGEMVEVDGRHGLLYEQVPGTSMMEVLGSRPWTLYHSARLLAELQAEMHKVEGAKELPSQHDRLRRKIQAAEILSPELAEAALKALETLPEGDRLCHGDFHPDNVLLGERGAIVIDWIDATRGNPLADVARSSLLMDMSPLPEGASKPLRWLFTFMRGLYHRAYLSQYFHLHPGDWSEFTAWRVVNAAARLEEGVPEEQKLLAFVQRKLTR